MYPSSSPCTMVAAITLVAVLLTSAPGAKGAKPEVTPAGLERYDLRYDPHEMRNVYDNRAYAETVADLKAELFRLKKEVGDMDETYLQLIERLRETVDEGTALPAPGAVLQEQVNRSLLETLPLETVREAG